MTSKSVGSILAAALCLAALLSSAAPAWALRQRTFVAADPLGNDANAAVDCTLAQPCRTFNVAIAHTLANGEIVILDTAGYGPMTIDKSIKIVGPAGVYGGISVQSGGANTGVVINASDTDVVTLRGLDIVGVSGAPLIGIDIQNAGTVHIEKNSINNFTQDTGGCIHVVSSKPIQVFVNDSFLRECVVGVWAEGTGPDTSRLSLVVDNTRIQDGLNTVTPGDTAAFVLAGAVIASIRNSVLSSAGDGIYANNSNVNVRTRIHVMDTQFSRFGFGAIETDGTAGASLHVNVAHSHFNNSNAALLHRHGQVILNSNVIANHTFGLVDCGGGAANVTSLGYGGGNGSNEIGNNTDLGPFPGGCSGIITPTQFAGK